MTRDYRATVKEILIPFLFLLTACTQPIQYTQLPTPQTIRVAYLSPLAPLVEHLQVCISEQPRDYFVFNEIPTFSVHSQGNLTFWIGEKPDSPGYAAPIGWDTLKVIVNPKNPIRELDDDDIRDLFSAKIPNWRELEGDDRPVSVWIYPEEDEIQRQFSLFLGNNNRITSMAFLASTPAIVREAVASDPGAIGFLPSAWIEAGITPIHLESDALTLPVMVLSDNEPEGASRNFIACLQSPRGQAALKSKYQPWNK